MKKELSTDTLPPNIRGTVAVIGGGWYGAHISAALALRQYSVVLFESEDAIFKGISGKFGIRIHVGPHYPRSRATRKSCQSGYHEFLVTYPELVNEHEHAIYALGRVDAAGQPSKVDANSFAAVCEELGYKNEINLQECGYNSKELQIAFDLKEPSAVLGSRLRAFFQRKLLQVGVDVRCNVKITGLTKQGMKIIVHAEQFSQNFDHVINTTSYKALLPVPRPLPFDMEFVYQPCLALIYRDKSPANSGKPVSFIVMDGWYPCLMPYDDRQDKCQPITKYIMTHGQWTIMSTYDDLETAKQALSIIDDSFILEQIKAPSQAHMLTFWPNFAERFEYEGWTGEILAKLKTRKEFRSGFAIQCEQNNVISVFPGKITNIFDAERDALALINQQDILKTTAGYRYVRDSVLHHAQDEVKDKPAGDGRSTAELQTFRVLLDRLSTQKRQTSTSQYNKAVAQPKASSKLTTALSVLHFAWELLWNQPKYTKISTFGCLILAAYGLYRQMMRPNGVVSGLMKCGLFKSTVLHPAQIANNSQEYTFRLGM